MKITERAAYIKGLMEGLELDPNDKQTKVLKALVELVGDMAEDISDLGQCYDDVCDQIDALDEDLAGVEDLIYEDEEDEDDEDDDYYGCDCEEPVYEATCPTCGTTITLDETDLEKGGTFCPECGETLEFDYDEDELDDTDDESDDTDESDDDSDDKE